MGTSVSFLRNSVDPDVTYVSIWSYVLCRLSGSRVWATLMVCVAIAMNEYQLPRRSPGFSVTDPVRFGASTVQLSVSPKSSNARS